jgi:CDP-glucose 4,6-dehydratase
MVMDESFWQNKKVLLTGHTGFKGGWLTLWLQSVGANVIGYSLPSVASPNLFELACLKSNMNSHMGDIRDFDTLHRFINKEQPDIVFHLAAQALVRHSYINPIETYSTNVMGTVNLLEALRQVGCARAVVIITSDKCYDNREWWWGYRETEPLGGRDPYSSSKGCAELVTASYRHSFFTHQDRQPLFLASARAGNVIGGGDFATDRLIPDFFHAMIRNNPLKVRNPHAIRPWQHVLEPLYGYLMLAERLWTEGEVFAGAWNFGPEGQETITVEWIANYLIRLWGEGASWELDNQENLLHEAHYLKLDISKALLKLMWKPRWSLETALCSTVAWYKAYLKNQSLRKVMLEQIAEFQAT